MRKVLESFGVGTLMLLCLLIVIAVLGFIGFLFMSYPIPTLVGLIVCLWIGLSLWYYFDNE